MLDTIMELTPESEPLRLADLPPPIPKINEVLIKVSVCGVCHTELDEIEGRTPPAKLPMILGHQVVGRIVEVGSEVTKRRIGERVGVAWIHSSCQECSYCKDGNENLCDQFKATGRDAYGGYAEFMTAPAKYAYEIPEFYSDSEAAPLLCAGAVGYRSLRLTHLKNGDDLGLTGFGASAHLVLKLVQHQYPQSDIYVFARKNEERDFALQLGAKWAGDISDESPVKLFAVIDTTPAWKPVVEAMKNLKKGGRLVINAIRKEETDKTCLQHLSYKDHLWQEKEIKSVANVTARDVVEFLNMAEMAGIRPHVQEYKLQDVNKALTDIKFQRIKGAKVLRMS